MNDLEQLETMLKKAGAHCRKVTPEDHDFNKRTHSLCQTRLLGWPGYQAHFEAEFDASGNILNIGQWDDM